MLNDAARRRVLHLHGKRTFKLGSVKPSPFSSGTEPIEPSYFDDERDFDAQWGQIFAVTRFDDAERQLEMELFATRGEEVARLEGVYEWGHVTIDRSSLIKWLDAHAGQQSPNEAPAAPQKQRKHNRLDYQGVDAAHYPQMKEWIDGKLARSPKDAAGMLIETMKKQGKAIPGASDSSTISRLAEGYRKANPK